MEYIYSMITTITQKNMVTIPSKLAQKLGIRPGYQLEWSIHEGNETLIARVIPDREGLARRLWGAGKGISKKEEILEELIAEREREG